MGSPPTALAPLTGIIALETDAMFGTRDTMRDLRATYQNGKITLSEKPSEPGPMDVLVVFPELGDDPWERILNDAIPRPALTQWMKEVEREIAEGKASPLDLDQL